MIKGVDRGASGGAAERKPSVNQVKCVFQSLCGCPPWRRIVEESGLVGWLAGVGWLGGVGWGRGSGVIFHTVNLPGFILLLCDKLFSAP